MAAQGGAHGSSIRVHLLAAASLLVGGCAVEVHAPASYRVAVEPELRDDAVEATWQAVQAWQGAIPELRLALVFAPCAAGDGPTICVGAGDGASAEIVGETSGIGTELARVKLELANLDALGPDGASVYLAALHELGHGMGLVHLGPGTVMAPEQHQQTSEPTPDDVAQWEER